MIIIISLLKSYYVVSILFCISGCIGKSTKDELCKDKRVVHPKDRKFGSDDQSQRIIGGHVATPHMYPYQVGIYITAGYGGHNKFFCGGSLITSEYVLTAAHCLEEALGAVVYLGAHDLANKKDPSRIHIQASRFIFHDFYDKKGGFEHDIALIKLTEKATLNEYVNIIDIDDGDDLHVGSTATCSGWGRTSEASKTKLLRYVDLKIMPNSECEMRIATKITGYHICGSGEDSQGPNVGDSGGPLVLNGILVGVVAFGSDACDNILPSIYTRVSKYSSWIYRKSGKIPKPKNKGRGGRRAPLMEASVGIAFCLIFVNYF